MRNHISQQKLRETPFLESSNYHRRRIIIAHDVIIFLQAVIITVYTTRVRIIIAHDVIISLQSVRGRIIIAHDVIIFLQAVIITVYTTRGRIIMTHDVIISLQQMLKESYQDGERVRDREWERVCESEWMNNNVCVRVCVCKRELEILWESMKTMVKAFVERERESLWEKYERNSVKVIVRERQRARDRVKNSVRERE